MSFTMIFTLKEANDLIPTLGPLLELVVGMDRRLHGKLLQLESLTLLMSNEGQPTPRIRDQISQVNHELEEVNLERTRLEEAIRALGCIVRCEHQGVVDFPALHQGKLIFFCWQRNEPCIQFWHEASEGATERRVLKEIAG